MSERVPFTILTGWLGAGKTSALNRMLASAQGKRIAVLVNELGRISIDTQLIVGRGGDVLELAGGCICCSVDLKNDLWDGIGDIIERSKPDHVVLETTGIAEPAAILEGLVKVVPRVRDRIQPAGVVCVIDGEDGAIALDQRDEAREQAGAADRILMSKLDIATVDAVKAAHARLDRYAAHAERASFPSDDAGARAMTAWVTEVRKLRAWQQRRPHTASAHEHVPTEHSHDHGGWDGHVHHRGGQLIAVTFSDDAPLVGDRVLAVLNGLGDRLVRAKGFVNLADEERRGFVERAGSRTSLEMHTPWGDDPRRTEIVLIGDDLDEAAIQRALWACRTGGLPF
ncbi:MAG TPA: GTP-binding protein [Kofleriaceae bacterium]|jgi:G3E family GTPase